MTDRGLEEEIRTTGSASRLRIPAERVLTVKPVIGIARVLPRLEIHQAVGVDDTDLARAQDYALLATLLTRAPDKAFLQQLATLRRDPTLLGVAHVGLAEAAASATAGEVEREFFELFIGIGRGELMPYGSYYIAGFLHERPLARLREDLAVLGIERVEGQYESEDHAAILCEVMSGIVGRQFPASAGTDRQMFERHLAPWIGHFFTDLERAGAADFYRRVGTLGRVFIDIESEAFALAE
jgi:TorA maturation chaperone TorD